MKSQTLIRLSRIILLAFAVSVAALALVYALQHPELMAILGTVSWNG
jgi:hypothetical protein